MSCACSHPQSRVSAKVVYNEFIASRDHIHMNSTRWYTLTEFVKYLGKEGGASLQVLHRDMHACGPMLLSYSDHGVWRA